MCECEVNTICEVHMCMFMNLYTVYLAVVSRKWMQGEILGGWVAVPRSNHRDATRGQMHSAIHRVRQWGGTGGEGSAEAPGSLPAGWSLLEVLALTAGLVDVNIVCTSCTVGPKWECTLSTKYCWELKMCETSFHKFSILCPGREEAMFKWEILLYC